MFHEQERDRILGALKLFDDLVPAVDTFLEDFKCLQV